MRPCCCISASLLFDIQHDIYLKKLSFALLTPKVSVSVGKIFATMLLNFVTLFNLICNMTIFWKS